MPAKIEAVRYDHHLKDAARRVVEQMSSVEGEHVARLIGESLYGEGECSGPVPMWGTMFRVVDPCDSRMIASLLEPIIPDEDDEEGLRALIEEYGLSIEPEAYGDECGECEGCADESTCKNPDIDWEDFRTALIEALQESGCEDAEFHSAGYSEINGILGIEIEGDLYLGINGAGYDFYESHWIPLYQALGYSWHLHTLKRDLFTETARTLAYAESVGERERLAVDLRNLCELDASTLERAEGGE